MLIKPTWFIIITGSVRLKQRLLQKQMFKNKLIFIAEAKPQIQKLYLVKTRKRLIFLRHTTPEFI